MARGVSGCDCGGIVASTHRGNNTPAKQQTKLRRLRYQSKVSAVGLLIVANAESLSQPTKQADKRTKTNNVSLSLFVPVA